MRETTRILTTDFSSILSLGAPGQNFIALALNRFTIVRMKPNKNK